MTKVKPGASQDSDRAFLVAQNLLLREANALDTQQWDEWLALYTDDAIFWLPAWLDEYQTTSDVNQTMSYMYHEGRLALSERVARITSKKSATAMPLPRTVHLVSGPLIAALDGNEMTVKSNSIVHVYDTRAMRTHVTACRCEHILTRGKDAIWLIKRKKVILVNDCMPSVIDFYAV